ncbi:hypothetical protein CPB84DRAFT_1848149 [Gymnopilus junonius]|uniref:Uncharacterized protein n=1 Tax=Gymnopilus junonius TaxID=109634 RepID=A0A9P5NNJ0_GYMJU|nr:hypothetical protein CPB84DRAFT_1848149 [Gymnopilus junonius]
MPFWKHRTLKAVDDSGCQVEDVAGDNGIDSDDDLEDDEEDEAEDLDWVGNVVDLEDGCTFEEAMNEELDFIMDFLAGLRFQVQFRDHRMLAALKRKGRGFRNLGAACLGKEKRLKSQADGTLSTWDKSMIASMFYQARPSQSDAET